MKVYTVLCTVSTDETNSKVLGVFFDKEKCIKLIKKDFDEQVEEFELIDDVVLRYESNIDIYESNYSGSYSNEQIYLQYRIEEFEVV